MCPASTYMRSTISHAKQCYLDLVVHPVPLPVPLRRSSGTGQAVATGSWLTTVWGYVINARELQSRGPLRVYLRHTSFNWRLQEGRRGSQTLPRLLLTMCCCSFSGPCCASVSGFAQVRRPSLCQIRVTFTSDSPQRSVASYVLLAGGYFLRARLP